MKKSRQVLSLIFSAIMIFAAIPFSFSAGATSISQEQAVEWIKARGNEKWWKDVDGAYGCQCVDLIKEYYSFLGCSQVLGNAYNYISNSLPSGWYRDNTPTPGSIIVWDRYTNAYYSSSGYWYTGDYGHIGLVYAVSGSTVYTVETNTGDGSGYDTGSKAKFATRYNKNATYIHPNFAQVTKPHTCDYKASATITKAPTRTTEGTRVRTCSCGKTYTQTIPAIPYTTDIKEGVYVIRSKCNSNLVICTNKISEHNVLLTNFNDTYSDQFWIFIKNDDGTYTIENLYYNNYVIDVYNNSMVNGGNICSYPRKSENYNNERFYIIPSGSYYKLVNKLSYNVVDAEWNNGVCAGTNIIQYENGSGDNQLWSFTPCNPTLAVASNSITLSEGNSTSVTCSIKPEAYGVTIQPNIGDMNICSIKWDNWKGMSIPLSITGKKAGNTYIELNLIDADTKIVYDTQTIKVSVTDVYKPKGTISSTNNVAASQTVTLSISDNAGLAGYYWGTSSAYSSNTYTAVSGTSKSVTKTVSSNGTYYLTVKDTSGNISSSISKTFYRTTLNPNNGSVSPTSVLTMSGYSFTLPTPTRTGYTFNGWNTKADGSGTSYAPGDKYTANADVTLYAQWKEEVPVLTSDVFVFKIDDENIYYANQDVKFTTGSAATFDENKKTIVPLRAIAAATGVNDLKYDSATKKITFTGVDGYSVEMQTGSTICKISKGTDKFEIQIAAPYTKDGSAMLPLRDTTNLVGGYVKYDNHYIVVSKDTIDDADIPDYIAAFDAK